MNFLTEPSKKWLCGFIQRARITVTEMHLDSNPPNQRLCVGPYCCYWTTASITGLTYSFHEPLLFNGPWAYIDSVSDIPAIGNYLGLSLCELIKQRDVYHGWWCLNRSSTSYRPSFHVFSGLVPTVVRVQQTITRRLVRLASHALSWRIWITHTHTTR